MSLVRVDSCAVSVQAVAIKLPVLTRFLSVSMTLFCRLMRVCTVIVVSRAGQLACAFRLTRSTEVPERAGVRPSYYHAIRGMIVKDSPRHLQFSCTFLRNITVSWFLSCYRVSTMHSRAGYLSCPPCWQLLAPNCCRLCAFAAY